MQIVNLYTGEGNFTSIKLSKPIETCDSNAEVDISKLDALLSTEKSRMKNVAGIYDWKEGRLTAFDNGAFSAVIWTDMQPINGEWKLDE